MSVTEKIRQPFADEVVTEKIRQPFADEQAIKRTGIICTSQGIKFREVEVDTTWIGGPARKIEAKAVQESCKAEKKRLKQMFLAIQTDVNDQLPYMGNLGFGGDLTKPVGSYLTRWWCPTGRREDEWARIFV